MIDFTVTGLDEMIARLEGLSTRADAGMHEALLARAAAVRQRFIAATPVLTGAAMEGWAVTALGIQDGADSVSVSNPVRSPKGFPYPSALITGAGMRGAGAPPTAGYTGGFGATPGMLPAAALQAAWNDEARSTLATPAIMKTMLP